MGWTRFPSDSLKCYQSNIVHNGKNITIGGEGAKETVDMTGKSVLNAYKVVSGGKTYYNTYNLLKGSDGWDPLEVKDVIAAAGQEAVATQLTITQMSQRLNLEKKQLQLEVQLNTSMEHRIEHRRLHTAYQRR